MPRLPLRSRTCSFLAAALLSGAAPLVVPGAASAKTFVSHFDDPAGDATSGGSDLTAARVAYNRRTGAISATVTFAHKVDTSSGDTVAIGFSNLIGGHCTAAILDVGVTFSHPQIAFAQGIKNRQPSGKYYVGHATVDGREVSMRVRDRALAGKTVGCVFAMVIHGLTKDGGGETVDETAIDNGFNG